MILLASDELMPLEMTAPDEILMIQLVFVGHRNAASHGDHRQACYAAWLRREAMREAHFLAWYWEPNLPRAAGIRG